MLISLSYAVRPYVDEPPKSVTHCQCYARLTVTFPAAGRQRLSTCTKLYSLVTIATVKKTEWWGASVVICLERGADLHMAQLMPLPLTVSCFSEIQIGFTFLVPGHPGSPGQRAVKRVCVCVCVC